MGCALLVATQLPFKYSSTAPRDPAAMPMNNLNQNGPQVVVYSCAIFVLQVFVMEVFVMQVFVMEVFVKIVFVIQVFVKLVFVIQVFVMQVFVMQVFVTQVFISFVSFVIFFHN